MTIVFISSSGRCGIREYSHILMEGFRALGYTVHYSAVERHNNADLRRALRQIKRDCEVVIFEYEPAIFTLWGLAWAMLRLRLRGKVGGNRPRIILSIHEIGVDKYAEGRQAVWYFERPVDARWWMEAAKLLYSTFDIARLLLKMRAQLLFLGWFPDRILVHSPKALKNMRLVLAPDQEGAMPDRVQYVPHVVKTLRGERDALRDELGLPLEPFAFIIPGFIFRRKRIIEVISKLPPKADLWVVGTVNQYDQRYPEEVRAYVAQSPNGDRVRIIHDYERLEHYLGAADAGVFYYSAAFQSGVASLAVGAGKPCIFSDLPAFDDLRGAGLTVCDSLTLADAMVQIQASECYQQLAKAAQRLRVCLGPEQIAQQYLSSNSQKAS